MALKIWNIGKANAIIEDADAVLNPALATAGITNITVDGKAVPATEAPLAAKLSALFAVSPVGGQSQQVSDVIVSNDQLAKELEKVNGELTTQTASVQSLTAENARLKQENATLSSSVSSLTAENADYKNRNSAALNQVTSKTAEVNAINRTVSQFCLKADCLTLTTPDGKALAKDATDAEKLSAAEAVPVAEKITSLFGAVNAAVAKTGVSFAQIPAPGGSTATASQKPELKGRERMKAAMKVQGQ